MGSPFSPQSGEAPASPPLDSGYCSPLGECAALTLRLHEARRQIEEARQQSESAADKAWVAVVDALWDTGQRPAPPADAPRADACDAAAWPAWIERLWRDQEIEVLSPSAAKYGDTPGEAFEILATRPAPGDGEGGTIVEVWRPAIRRQGRLIRRGQVIVLQPEPSTQEEPT